MLTFQVDAERLSRSRFALSRLAELTNGLEVLTHPGRAPFARRWVRQIRRRLDPARIDLVDGLVGHDSSYVPDFLVPIPREYEPSLDTELAGVATAPADLVRDQLCRTFRIGPCDEPDARAPLPSAVADALAAGGEAHLTRLVADQLRYCWHEVLSESWPLLRRVLDADVRHRAMVASREGFAAIVEDLHPRVSWDGGRLTVRTSHDASLSAEPGIVLTPSVFLPGPAVWVGGPGEAMVGYPALGRGRVWSEPAVDPTSAPILGDRRSALLADLATSRTTSELAARHRLSPATVSYHLARLRTAGLVARTPVGRAVRYERTDYAETLLAALEAD